MGALGGGGGEGGHLVKAVDPFHYKERKECCLLLCSFLTVALH